MSANRQYLLVDGYNIVHAWPETRRLLSRDVDAAAALLVEKLAVLHDPDTCEVTVVFDGRGERAESISGGGALPFVIYAQTGRTADAVIEQIVARAPDAKLFTIATRDNAITLSVHTRGATVIGPDALADWAERQRAQVERTVVRKLRSDGSFGGRLFG
jgi:predicted RNA-binding protein with PIN domain